jgi:hypothetical protein
MRYGLSGRLFCGDSLLMLRSDQKRQHYALYSGLCSGYPQAPTIPDHWYYIVR